MKESSEITPIGLTNFRNQKQRFGIKDKDRLGHIYAIGKTGVGKSTLLENMAISDIERGNGLGIIDPHGDISKNILNYIPQYRIQDVIYLNPGDLEYPIGFNPLHGISASHYHVIASGLITTLKKLWIDSWGPRLEHILRLTILTLLEFPRATLLDIQSLLVDKDFRKHVLLFVKSPYLRSFWLAEFDKYSPQLRSEAISPILNKVGLFQSNAPLRNIVGQEQTTFRMQEILNQGKIFIANLSKGEIGDDASSLLGSMLVTAFQLAALSRNSLREEDRKPFYLYIDEMHNFISLSVADILAESRKYGLSLFLTHQYIEQIDERIRAAIFGNIGTLISFRVGAPDAEELTKEFYPVFSEEDFISLPKYSMYLKLLVDGATTQPFSADSLPLKSFDKTYAEEVIIHSRKTYAKKRNEVETAILARIRDFKKTDAPFHKHIG